ncbi:hypothetical protein [Lentzea flava]|nr:hypothetical protein [Lentzea flava]
MSHLLMGNVGIVRSQLKHPLGDVWFRSLECAIPGLVEFFIGW